MRPAKIVGIDDQAADGAARCQPKERRPARCSSVESETRPPWFGWHIISRAESRECDGPAVADIDSAVRIDENAVRAVHLQGRLPVGPSPRRPCPQ
jgi:hypothetical protein